MNVALQMNDRDSDDKSHGNFGQYIFVTMTLSPPTLDSSGQNNLT